MFGVKPKEAQGLSPIVASGSSGSGATNVSLKGGSWAAFFEPTFHCISWYSKCSCQSFHTTTLLMGSYDFFTTLFRIPIWCRIFTTLFLTWFTSVSLLSIRCMTISYQILAATVLAANLPWCFLQFAGWWSFHVTTYPLSMTHYRFSKPFPSGFRRFIFLIQKALCSNHVVTALLPLYSLLLPWSASSSIWLPSYHLIFSSRLVNFDPPWESLDFGNYLIGCSYLVIRILALISFFRLSSPPSLLDTLSLSNVVFRFSKHSDSRFAQSERRWRKRKRRWISD